VNVCIYCSEVGKIATMLPFVKEQVCDKGKWYGCYMGIKQLQVVRWNRYNVVIW
jgi:hypothetical protein